MDPNVTLVPIPPHETEQQINQLVERRSWYGIRELSKPGEALEAARGMYLEAHRGGLILRLTLAIQALGQLVEPGLFRWQLPFSPGLDLIAVHNANNGTTVVRVGELVVLSDETPGQELLRPGAGKWLKQMSAEYDAHLAKAEWASRTQQQKQVAKEINEFLADV